MSTAKAKGTAWESAVRDFLNEELGQYVTDWRDADYRWKDPHDLGNVNRQVQAGVLDVGDLHARPFVLEAKAEKSIRLAEYVRQANREAANAGFKFGAAVVKAPRRNVKNGYVVMDLATFARVLEALRE
ncbi:hypothetical protein ACFC0S_03090 [Streptomyces sp. NPDC056084]|uniref:hypothetical protein n=1 Tax=unclassified Streptomyces TaxID=2593676 RepID=UPI0035DFC04F